MERLYTRHGAELSRYCRSILRHDEDAMDAIQATFTKALTSLPDSFGPDGPRPWLFRVAHNEAISIIRRRRSTDADIDETPVASERSVEQDVSMRADLRELQADLADLTERQRAALVLRELNGLGHEEIASVLETTPRAVKQVIYEARSALLECREGRAVACEDIRRALSDADGRVTRSRRMRSHLRDCTGCREFREDLDRRPRQLAAIAPPLPLLAGGSVLADLLARGADSGATEVAATALAGAGSAATGVGTLVSTGGAATGAGVAAATATSAGAGGLLGGVAAKVAVVVALAGGGASGAVLVADDGDRPAVPSTSVPARTAPSPSPAPAAGAVPATAPAATSPSAAPAPRGETVRTAARRRAAERRERAAERRAAARERAVEARERARGGGSSSRPGGSGTAPGRSGGASGAPARGASPAPRRPAAAAPAPRRRSSAPASAPRRAPARATPSPSKARGRSVEATAPAPAAGGAPAKGRSDAAGRSGPPADPAG